MAFKTYNLDNYHVTLFDKRWDEIAVIRCDIANVQIYFYFVDDKEDRNNVINDEQIRVYFPVSNYPRVLDLLRNEHPITFRIEDTNFQAQIFTGKETVGEGE